MTTKWPWIQSTPRENCCARICVRGNVVNWENRQDKLQVRRGYILTQVFAFTSTMCEKHTCGAHVYTHFWASKQNKRSTHAIRSSQLRCMPRVKLDNAIEIGGFIRQEEHCQARIHLLVSLPSFIIKILFWIFDSPLT